MKKLFEIEALVRYSVVIAAESKEQAMQQVETWEHAWDANADLVGVSDVGVTDIREPLSTESLSDEAHIVCSVQQAKEEGE